MDSKILAGACLLWLLVFGCGCAGKGENPAQTHKQLSSSVVGQHHTDSEDQDEQSQRREDWGIQVESAMLSAAGYMVDFRFRVLDAKKAAPLFDRKVMPVMTDQATGAKFIVPSPPKVGQLRSGGRIEEGKTYFMFFANPAKYVKSGNKITVEVGDFVAQDIVLN